MSKRNLVPYEHGKLHQACFECGWWMSGHNVEIESCLHCGKPLGPSAGMQFGGLIVEYDGIHFILTDNGGYQLAVDRADYPDVLTFMLRHADQLPIPGSKKSEARSGVGNYTEQDQRMNRMCMFRKYDDKFPID